VQLVNRNAIADWVLALALCHLAGLAISFIPRAVSADEPVSDAKKQALKSLRGEWLVEWTVSDGDRLEDRRASFVFSDGQYTLTQPGLRPSWPDQKLKFHYELNVSRDPWVMRVTPQWLGPTPMTYIIRVTGDKLEMCQGERDVVPTVFDAAKGSRRYLMILKRVGPTEGAFADDEESPQKPDVSLVLSKASAERVVPGKPLKSKVLVQCEVMLNNQTGKKLTVTSDRSSAYDALEVVVTKSDGTILAQQAYGYHFGLGAFSRFELNAGKNVKTLVFPISNAVPSDLDVIKVRLVGSLPGSGYKRILSSDTLEVKIPSK
jgi:hypothetical protein